MSPQRIQLRRTRGWQKPEGAVVVSRPTRWGNPFRPAGLHFEATLIREPGFWKAPCPHVLSEPGLPGIYRSRDVTGAEYEYTVRRVRDLADAIECFRRYVRFEDDGVFAPANIRRELAGRDLCCWCPLDQTCHADVLLELANGPAS